MQHEVLAIIPARGGSVRVPKKNIKLLNGTPLISYPILTAKQSETVSRIVVSTDDDEIKDIALKYGAEIPFKRPPEISKDVPTEDVVLHAVQWLQQNEEYSPEIVVCLEPPVPFRKAEHIDRCVNAILNDKSIDSAITVTNVGGMRPEWMVNVTKDNLIEPYTNYFTKQGKALIKFPASQEFDPLFKTTGVVFSCRVETLLNYRSLVGVRCSAIEIDKKVTFDLDYPEDFEMCEEIIKQKSGIG